MRRRTRAIRPGLGLLLGGALACLQATTASAQFVLMDQVSSYFDWEYDLDGRVEYQIRTDVDGGTDFDVLRFEGGLDLGGPPSKSVRLFLDLDYAHTRYDFSRPPVAQCPNIWSCALIDPWQNVHEVDVAPGASLVLNDSFHIVAMVPMRWSFEGGTAESGFTAAGVLAVRIAFSDSFSTLLGVGVQNEIEDSLSVYPVIALDWRLTDGLSLLTRGSPYQGGEAALVWAPSDNFEMSLSGGYAWRRFRLGDRLPNPNGVGQYTSVPLLIGGQLNIQRRLELQLEGGIAVAGRLEVENSRGFRLRSERFDTAGLIRGALRILF